MMREMPKIGEMTSKPYCLFCSFPSCYSLCKAPPASSILWNSNQMQTKMPEQQKPHDIMLSFILLSNAVFESFLPFDLYHSIAWIAFFTCLFNRHSASTVKKRVIDCFTNGQIRPRNNLMAWWKVVFNSYCLFTWKLYKINTSFEFSCSNKQAIWLT